MVKRYSPYITEPDLVTLTVEAKLGEHPQGKYVLASDYDALHDLLKLVQSDPGNWLHSDLQEAIVAAVGEDPPYRSVDDPGVKAELRDVTGLPPPTRFVEVEVDNGLSGPATDAKR